MIRLSEKPAIYRELYEALTFFMSRQQLVIRAVLDQGVAPDDLRLGVAGWADKTAQRGDWGPEWALRFHGGGCTLTHRRSGEPVDWNGPDPQAFGVLAFVHHLKWRLAQAHDLPGLRAAYQDGGEQAVIRLIDDLIADGIITPQRHLLPQVAAGAA